MTSEAQKRWYRQGGRHHSLHGPIFASANGKMHEEIMSEHVDIESPMNLLGRDLMRTLGIGVIPCEGGISAYSVNYWFS